MRLGLRGGVLLLFLGSTLQARTFTVRLEGQSELLKRTWAVEVCLLDAREEPHCVDFANPHGLGDQASALSATIEIGEGIAITHCRTTWGAPLRLSTDGDQLALLYPRGFSSGAGILSSHEGNCAWDEATRAVRASTPYFFETVRIEAYRSGFEKKDSYAMTILWQVLSSEGAEEDRYLDARGLIRSPSDESPGVFVTEILTRHPNRYRLTERWYRAHGEPLEDPPREVSGDTVITHKLP